MDKQTFSTLCEYFNMVHGVTVRAIDAFTDRDLNFRPKPEMRTPRELIFNVYSQEKVLAESAQLGQFSAEAAGRSGARAHPARAARRKTSRAQTPSRGPRRATARAQTVTSTY